MNEKFHELVNRIAVQYLCTRPEVLEVVSKWFTIHNNDLTDLKDALEMYGGLRDLGYPHGELLHAIKYIYSLWFLIELKKKRCTFGEGLPNKLPELRLIRDE